MRTYIIGMLLLVSIVGMAMAAEAGSAVACAVFALIGIVAGVCHKRRKKNRRKGYREGRKCLKTEW